MRKTLLHATVYVLSFTGLWIAPGPAARAQTAAGTPVAEFIASLRDQGFTIIYSSDLVPDTLRLSEAPRAATPLAQLREVLAAHGLALEPGPRGSWLVVAAAAATAERPTTDAPGPPQVAAPTLENVVVSASRYAFARSTSPSQRQLDRRQLETAPTLGEDALRTTHSLPGVTSSGLTAQINVRGGVSDEALLLLDGVRLYSPYHLKDFESVFGSISPRIVDRIDVQTGGFPAEHGDRMSAVIATQSLTPDTDRHFELGFSTLTSSVLSSGRFADAKGEWVTSLRRGNLDLVATAADADVGEPRYADFFNKVGYAFSDSLSVTAGALLLQDNISLNDGDETQAQADYDDSYVWVAVDHRLRRGLVGRYLLASTRLVSDRTGSIDDSDTVTGELRDQRSFDTVAFKADWSLALGDRQRFEWGVAIEDGDASYDFASSRELPFPIRVPELATAGDGVTTVESFSDQRRSAYATYRAQPMRRLTTELGLRWDERTYLADSGVSPRFSVLLDIGSRASLRASWGRFRQMQGINELQVGDGLAELFPAQEAEHEILGFEYLLGGSITLRAEAFNKEFERIHPRFENLYMRVSLLPELLPDRAMIAPLSSRASGVELSLESRSEPWQWWVSYTRSSVEDELPNRWASRSWEEPRAVKAGINWTGGRWNASGSITTHTGWPVTEIALEGTELVAGPYNAERFASFRSLDVRGSRTFELERGSIDLFLELTNALDHKNPCCIEYSIETDAGGDPIEVSGDFDYWLPVIPSIGFLWEF